MRLNLYAMGKGVWAAILVSTAALGVAETRFPDIPKEYLEEAKTIPDFWISTVAGVQGFLADKVHKGSVESIGNTAGNRPIQAVFYGKPRGAKGATTYSGSVGARDVRAFFGPDHEKKVYLAMAGVHGGEFEGIVGIVNLVAVLETGRDLRGKEWPEITAAAAKLDRIILLPVLNVDGRSRVPFRMLRHWGGDYTVPEYFNTGGWKDGKNIGWPECKRYIPLDFAKTQFPGGYPNDAGVNLMHDDFFGHQQPETRALFDLGVRERPDLITNMHTGAVYTQMLNDFIEPSLAPAFQQLYRRVQGGLAEAGQRGTKDIVKESEPPKGMPGAFNLTTALNLNSGALAVLIESPSHAASLAKRDGKVVVFTADDLLTSQLTCHQEVMKFLAETGGRTRWAPK